MTDIAFLSATELADRIRSGQISTVELLQHYLDRVDRYNPKINAIVVDMREQAMDTAKHMDEAIAAGGIGLGYPFYGLPITVKEGFNVEGVPTTWGNVAWRENIPNSNAVAVDKLRNVGANIFGKTNVPLALADFQSYNEIYGTTNNPYDLTKVPGGSSGGSAAALAAGLTAFEIGSDIGGSIRNPAHFCGVFGHKSTYNLLWARGHAPPGDIRTPADISVIGPMARSASDLAMAMRVLAGPDDVAGRGLKVSLPEWSREIAGLRVAVWKNDIQAPVSKEIAKRVDLVARSLADAGAIIDEDARPEFDLQECEDVYQHLLHATLHGRVPEEVYQATSAQASELDADDQSRTAKVLRARVSSFRDWAVANEKRHQMRWRWHEFFQDHDVLLAPVMATPAFEHDHGRFGARKIEVDGVQQGYFQQIFWSGLTGVSYLPSTVVPTGLSESGLPIGIQVVGPEFSDLITIGVASELEEMGYRFEPPNLDDVV